MSLADRIRAHVIAHHIKLVSARGDRSVTVRAGDVHREMGLSNYMPSVCGAIGGRLFSEAANVTLIKRNGPRNGANVYFTFSLHNKRASETSTPRRNLRAAREITKPENKTMGEAGKIRETPPHKINLTGSLVLVSCVGQKQSRPAPARELYISSWFNKARALVGVKGADWYILSALHGLVPPDKVIKPYEKTLNNMPVAERRAWSANVFRQLEPLLKRKSRVVFFAGQHYREFLVGPLLDRGVTVNVPMQGLKIGEQLQWLTEALRQ